MGTITPALKCPHDLGTGFKLEVVDKGYLCSCRDCGITGSANPVLGLAMKSFEERVSKARAAERREVKKGALSASLLP